VLKGDREDSDEFLVEVGSEERLLRVFEKRIVRPVVFVLIKECLIITIKLFDRN